MKIRQLRIVRGLSQVALARMVGINQGVLSDIEHGKRLINSLELLEKFAAALGVEKEELY